MKAGILAVGLLAALVGAAEAVNPVCGQNLGGAWTMTFDMDCRNQVAGHAITLPSGSTLDCQGFQIIGPNLATPDDTQTGRHGIEIDGVSNVTVRNCQVKGFERGIRVIRSTHILIEDTTSKKNTRYGCDIGAQSGWITLDGVQAINNGDEGCHFGGPYIGPILFVNGLAYLNKREGLYLTGANGVTIRHSQATENSQDPSGSHPDINFDATPEARLEDVVAKLIRTVDQSYASVSMCVSMTVGACP